MTILYDTINEKILSKHNPYYTVDGQRPTLPENIVELEIVSDDPTPQYDEMTQKIISHISIDYNLKQWKRVWSVSDKTPEEIQDYQNNLTWPDRDWNKCIKISISDINTISSLQQFVSQLLLWWQMTGMFHKYENGYVYFYCNFIYPEHQSIVDQFLGLVVIEDSPWIEL